MARRVDTLMRVDTADSGSYLLAVEAQGRPDPDKLNSWTYYLAYLYAEHKLPPLLLVVCQDKPTASWAAQPIHIGLPAHTSIAVFPLVLGPENLPTIIDPDEAAEDLALAVFSALAHANDPALPGYWRRWRRCSPPSEARPRRTGRNTPRSAWATPRAAHSGGT
ncbi:hypothetical protein ACFC01_32490 [Streptomyces mirabilis]|uniref:hypothetical protein n=1 Tax=Streptomyces mirabilis TaxID=68239 RepID=UPI0035D9EC85